MLTDQVEAQGEKIRDLEFTKEEMQIKFEESEQFLESVSCFYIRLIPLFNTTFSRCFLIVNFYSFHVVLEEKTAGVHVLARAGKC